MNFVQRIRATVPVRRKADKEVVDALQLLEDWAEQHKHQTTETMRLLNQSLVDGDKDAVKKAYWAVSRLREAGRSDTQFVGMMEMLQDKLLERLDAVPARSVELKSHALPVILNSRGDREDDPVSMLVK